jgi:hypothetical protein
MLLKQHSIYVITTTVESESRTSRFEWSSKLAQECFMDDEKRLNAE